jgi:hypothetical protein
MEKDSTVSTLAAERSSWGSMYVFMCSSVHLGGAQVPGLTVLGNHVSLLMATQRCPRAEGGGSPEGYLLLISYVS